MSAWPLTSAPPKKSPTAPSVRTSSSSSRCSTAELSGLCARYTHSRLYLRSGATVGTTRVELRFPIKFALKQSENALLGPARASWGAEIGKFSPARCAPFFNSRGSQRPGAKAALTLRYPQSRSIEISQWLECLSMLARRAWSFLWHIASFRCKAMVRRLLEAKRALTGRPRRRVDEFTQRAPDRSCRRRIFVTQNSKVWGCWPRKRHPAAVSSRLYQLGTGRDWP